MKLFSLKRNIDISGVSGTGFILDGVIFDTGTVVAMWRKERHLSQTGIASLSIFSSMDEFENIHVNSHGRDSNTVVYWQDGKAPQ